MVVEGVLGAVRITEGSYEVSCRTFPLFFGIIISINLSQEMLCLYFAWRHLANGLSTVELFEHSALDFQESYFDSLTYERMSNFLKP